MSGGKAATAKLYSNGIGSSRDHVPSTKCLPTPVPVAGEGLFFGVRSFVSLYVLNTSARSMVSMSKYDLE